MAGTDNANEAGRGRKGSRIFTFAVLALLLIMVLSAVFVPLAVFRSRGKVVISYGQITVRRDLYVCWLAAYKHAYLTAAAKTDSTVADTPAFWATVTEAGVTRAADARDKADRWIRRVVFAAALFEEEGATLDQRTQETLENAYRRILQYDLNTEKAYDSEAKKVGFTYATVRRALLYQCEGENYAAVLSDEEFEAFSALADREIVLTAAAEKIDFVSLPADNELLFSAFSF